MRILFTMITLSVACCSNAQNFKAAQVNPFGIDTAPFEYNDMQFADLTGDGAFDIVFNDFYEGPFILINQGTAFNPDFSNSPMLDFFSFEEDSIAGFGLLTDPTSYFVDLDGDGDLDHLSNYSSDIPSLPAEYACDFNLVEAADPEFVYHFGGPEHPGSDIGLPNLPLNSLEVFALADLDGDNDPDILGIRFDELTGAQRFVFYESLFSTGTYMFSGSAIESPFGLPINNNGEDTFGFPAFFDPDKDGDQDMLISLIGGEWAYYENIGTPSAPQFTLPVNNPFGLTAIPTVGAPYFIDINGDGNKDLIIGGENSVHYFEFDATSPTIDLKNDFQLDISPNPCSNLLAINSEKGSFVSIHLMDAKGILLKEHQFDETQNYILSISDLLPGIYFIGVTTKKGITTISKIIKT